MVAYGLAGRQEYAFWACASSINNVAVRSGHVAKMVLLGFSTPVLAIISISAMTGQGETRGWGRASS